MTTMSHKTEDSKLVADTATPTAPLEIPAVRQRVGRFLKKYFWQGQHLDEKTVVDVPDDASFLERFIILHRRALGLIIPLVFCQTVYWSLAIRHNFFQYFPDKYPLTLTMIFGATIAGATSEGGGAVAFPVMTLLLHVAPGVARDTSMLIQSSGMSAASFGIFFMRQRVEYNALIFCSAGGMIGLIFGLHYIDPFLPAAYKKMLFVSIFFAFAIALFILNREKKRRTFDKIPRLNCWKAAILLVVGFVGGSCTSFAGSGLDICSFSVLTLLFHVSEKVATPTSVILMASNSAVGVFWRQFMMNGAYQEAWEYIAVTLPIVTVFAPLGNLICSHFHRQVMASMIYILESVALICGFIFVKPNVTLSLISCGIIVGGALLFFFLSQLGKRIIQHEEESQQDILVNHKYIMEKGIGGGLETEPPESEPSLKNWSCRT